MICHIQSDSLCGRFLIDPSESASKFKMIEIMRRALGGVQLFLMLTWQTAALHYETWV